MKKNGFTLIEILIASSIMVMVLTASFVIFKSIYNSYWQIKAITTTSQAGRYVLETLSREARLAKEFTIDSANNALTLTDQNDNTHTYTFSSGGITVTKSGSADPHPMTNSHEVGVSEIGLVGSNFNVSTTQPWAQIKFTLTYKGEENETFGSAQSFQTTVTSRKYSDE